MKRESAYSSRQIAPTPAASDVTQPPKLTATPARVLRVSSIKANASVSLLSKSTTPMEYAKSATFKVAPPARPATPNFARHAWILLPRSAPAGVCALPIKPLTPMGFAWPATRLVNFRAAPASSSAYYVLMGSTLSKMGLVPALLPDTEPMRRACANSAMFKAALAAGMAIPISARPAGIPWSPSFRENAVALMAIPLLDALLCPPPIWSLPFVLT